MTEPQLTMNRLIHAAVRRDLERLSTALQGFRDGDSARARDLDRAFVNLRRGRYRVVLPKSAAGAALTSNTVRLKR